ncbi:MAG: proton-conducting transporter membrane subunit [Candidatus Micrarchaeales archaeon]|jgi:NADH-quinone oxidoreductase subunit L
MMPFAIIVPPILAILAIVLVRNNESSKYIALAGSLASFILLPLVEIGSSTLYWFSVGSVQLSITATLASFNYMVLWIVLLIGMLVIVYSFGFMDTPSEQKRYYVEMLSFEVAMLSLAMAGNFMMLFIGWEFLSLTSYLLIGFWHGRERAIAAARKAITIVFVGDIAFFASMIIFQSTFGTLQFGLILSKTASANFPQAAVGLLVIAILTKSAQFPFHEWLPDAMEGPTPVSAFLHSTTMVKAGVFTAIILFPLLLAAKTLNLIFLIGIVTVVIGMVSAFREQHIKRVLAYSTVQELGLMLIAVANNALLAAIYFFFVQSFYKALLFLSSGVTMKANEKENLDEISGIRRSRITYITTIFGVLSIAGFVPFAGFFANVGIASSFSNNLIVYIVISIVSLGTSFYMFRWLLLQRKRAGSARIALNYRSTPQSMLFSMAALAVFTLATSIVFFLLPELLQGAELGTAGTSLSLNLYDAILEIVVVAVGAAMSYLIYRQRKKVVPKKTETARTQPMMHMTWMTNTAYGHIAAFAGALAGVFEYLDSRINDRFDSLGHLVMISGISSRRMATGRMNTYVVAFVVGLLILAFAALVI